LALFGNCYYSNALLKKRAAMPLNCVFTQPAHEFAHMKKTITFFHHTSLLLLFSVGQMHAAERVVYQGTLEGAGRVVMELQPAEDPKNYTGRYFYPGQGIDIPLSGPADALIEPTALSEMNDDERSKYGDSSAAFNSPAAIWQGRIDAKRFYGEWTDERSGRKRSFDLKRIASYDPDVVKPGAVEAVSEIIAGGIGSSVGGDVLIDIKQTPYEFLKLEKQSVPSGKIFGAGATGYQMWRDPRTKLEYPRLSRHPDPKVLSQINRLLEQRHWQMNLAALECAATRYTDTGPAAGTLAYYDEEMITVQFLSASLMSISESGSTYCSGAHPNNHYELATFDLIRGEYLDWNRIMHGYVPGEYGYAEESEKLIAFMEKARSKQKYLTMTTPKEIENSCVDVFPEYLALSFTAPNILSFNVSGIGHAMGVCLGPQIEVPFKDLKPLLKPEAKAYLIPDSQVKK
jgi:hypothetical protein